MASRRIPPVITGWKAWAALGAVVLGAGVLTVTDGPGHRGPGGSELGAGSGAAAGPQVAASRPIPAALHVVALSAGSDRAKAEVTRRRTARFSLVGVTWDDDRAGLRGRVRIRTHATGGGWSNWHGLDVDDADRPAADSADAATARGGTAPLWVGRSDGFQMQVNGVRRTTLPAGLRVDLIDPDQASGSEGARPAMAPAAYHVPLSGSATGTTPGSGTGEGSADGSGDDPAQVPDGSSTPSVTASEDPSTPADGGSPETGAPAAPPSAPASSAPASSAPATTTPTQKPAAVAQPKIVNRAGWNADESIREPGDPDYSDAVKVVFVHHSDTAVDYSCTESASIIRGVYTYHVKSKGWRDIAYNFAVDKCGTIFEGRAGGIDRPVLGAHTYGFNTSTAGVVVLGNYVERKAPAAVLAAVAQVSAWKLGLTGADPSGKVDLIEAASDSQGFVKGQAYSFRTISGHRDGTATECPGQKLYEQLPQIRSLATAPTAPELTTLGGATRSGSTWYTRGKVTATWRTTTPAQLVDRTELIVDGSVKASVAGGTATQAALNVPVGRHTLAVRTVHVRGTTAETSATAVLTDPVAPTFSKAATPALRTGAVTAKAVPVTLSWKATDNTGLATILLRSPVKATLKASARSWKGSAAPGGRRTFTLRASDLAGNHRDSSVSVTPKITAETGATKTGTWTSRRNSRHLGGKALSSTRRNASLSWTVNGTSLAWIATRTSVSGKAKVYLDGGKVATVDLKSASTRYRQAVWTVSGLKAGRHTVKIVVEATRNRPEVIVDGVAALA